MSFEIVKGIPTVTVFGRGRPPKYPFDKMEVGDAFFLDSAEAPNARSSAWRWGRRHGVKFQTVQWLSDGKPDGYICQRVA